MHALPSLRMGSLPGVALPGSLRLTPAMLATRQARTTVAAAYREDRTIAQPVTSASGTSTAVLLRQSEAQPPPARNGNSHPAAGSYLAVANGDVQLEDVDLHAKPGDLDRTRFNLHWSVDYWRDWTHEPANVASAGSTSEKAAAQARRLVEAAGQAGVFDSSQSAAYWTYHLARTGFFTAQGLAGMIATQLVQRLTSKQEKPSMLDRMLQSGSSAFTRPIAESLSVFAQDLRNIQEGSYKLPWDMTTPRHRQYNPAFVASRTALFIDEASQTLQRRAANRKEDMWLESKMYPDYYLNTFHYQTDGWLSQRSARVYETSTETLFLGRQDAMQRQALVPLSSFLREAAGFDGAGARVLEVACGTGRFATFIKDNFPAASLTALDLSPYYLAEARQNMARWKRLRAPALAAGGYKGSGATFVQGAAEDIPAPDGSYDAVVSVYLFHELPPEVRKAVAAEMARVVRPGGVVILADSVQLGDRPDQDKVMGNFGDFNEPYYRSFIATDFGAIFEEAGLQADTKLIGGSTKVLSFRKPQAAPAPAAAEGSPAALV